MSLIAGMTAIVTNIAGSDCRLLSIAVNVGVVCHRRSCRDKATASARSSIAIADNGQCDGCVNIDKRRTLTLFA